MNRKFVMLSRCVRGLLGTLAMLAIGLAALAQPGGARFDHAPAIDAGHGGASFATVDLYIDVGDKPLAAYQVEFRDGGDGADVAGADAPGVRIVGVEGGQHAAFQSPPYYDPKAIQNDRVILAAFSTNAPDALPSGHTRIATIHVMLEANAEPRFDAKLVVATDDNGEDIAAELTFERRDAEPLPGEAGDASEPLNDPTANEPAEES